MSRLLFTREGDIKVFEFLKIALVIVFFVIGLSILFDHTMTIIRLSSHTIVISTILFISQLIISGYKILKDIHHMIKQIIIKIVFLSHENINLDIQKQNYFVEKTYIYTYRKYLRLSVIRC